MTQWTDLGLSGTPNPAAERTVGRSRAEAGAKAVVGTGAFVGRFLSDADDLLQCTFAVFHLGGV